MKLSQLIVNILLIGAIIYLFLRFKNRTSIATPIGSSSTPSEPATESMELKPLNWSKPLNYGDTGSEVVALQMMLMYFNPSQEVTGTLDDTTEFRMRTLTSGIFDGEVTLNGFGYSLFQSRFPGELENVIKKFPIH